MSVNRLGLWVQGMCCCLLAVVVAPAFAIGAPAWSAMGTFTGTNGVPGVDGPVSAAVCDAQGNLYVSGNFRQANNIWANRVAKWDGTQWSALGRGMDGYVTDLAVAPDGTLYASGSFNSAGGHPARNLARWDGADWQPCGDSTFLSYVYALAVDRQGRVYVGGSFSSQTPGVTNIAMWTGSVWTNLGKSVNGQVFSLTVDASDNVIAGGGFSSAGGVAVNNIAKWDGSAWFAMGSGMNNSVDSLAVDPQGNVWAGGRFTTAGGKVANLLAKWDGSAWSGISGGPSANYISGFAFDAFGNVYVCGPFYSLGGSPYIVPKYFAKWDGSVWTSYGDGSMINCLAQDSSGYIYVGGQFTTIDGQPAANIARWDGSFFTPFSADPVEGFVNAIKADGKGNIYVGGAFAGISGRLVNRIARWNGSSWSALGSGFSNRVRALDVQTVGSRDYVYAGGDFLYSGTSMGTSIDHFGLWDGSKWSELWYGPSSPISVVFVDRITGNLYAAGGFNYLYVSIKGQLSGLSLSGPALAVCSDGAGGVYAGGNFARAGEVAGTQNIARWNGTNWLPIVAGGSGANGPVYAVAAESGRLYIAGAFTQVNGVDAARIAYFDGSTWRALGSGLDGEARALTLAPRGVVLVTGAFQHAGGVAANRIAYWDGAVWAPLGSGLDRTGLALAQDGKGGLLVGGEFLTAGGVAAPYFAKVDISGLGEVPEVIRLRSVLPAGGGTWSLGFDAVNGNRYRIQYAGEPKGPWTTLASDLVATSSAAAWLDQGPPSSTQIHPVDVATRFYRVMKVKP